MKTPTHTPGPWAAWQNDAEKGTNYWRIRTAPYESGLQDTLHGYCGDANARLIAAAPELLAALRGLVARLESADPDWFTDECEGFDLYQAHSAIAKAIGH